MPLACDGAPLDEWTVPWPAVGPFVVDSWPTSWPGVMAHRVIGKSGFQLHTKHGCVIQFNLGYAQELCDAANAGRLRSDPEPKRTLRGLRE